MGDDRKVTELVEQSKLVFLREAVEDYKRRQGSYDLGTEFARTRRNRTAVVPGVIMAMLLLFSLGAVAVTFYIDQSVQLVELDFDEFEEVNLRQVLDAWLSVERQMEEAESAIEELTSERDARLRLAERTADRRIAIAGLTEISSDERADRVAEIESERDQVLAGISTDYGERISLLREERDDLLDRQDREFDEAEVEAALERQDLIEDQRRLFELEIADQREFYLERLSTLRNAYEQELASHDDYSEQQREVLTDQFEAEIARLRDEHEQEIEELTLRYNPDLSDSDIAALLEASLPESAANRSYRDVLGRAGALSEAAFLSLQNDLSELNAILDRLHEIPFENSVPDALDQLDARANAVVAEYERVSDRFADSYESLEGEMQVTIDRHEAQLRQRQEEMERRTGELASFEYAFGELIVDDRENGYVVDARDTGEIVVVIDEIRDIEDGTEAVVFREQAGYIADISFFLSDGRIRARAESVAAGESIRPFDRILIQLAGTEDPEIPTDREFEDENVE